MQTYMYVTHHGIEVWIDGVEAEIGEYVEGGAWVALDVGLVGTVDLVVLKEHPGDSSEAIKIRVDVVQPAVPIRM